MKSYSQKQLAVLSFFRKKRGEPIRPKDAAQEMGFKESSYIMNALLKLEKDGLLKKQGKGKYTTYQSNPPYKN